MVGMGVAVSTGGSVATGIGSVGCCIVFSIASTVWATEVASVSSDTAVNGKLQDEIVRATSTATKIVVFFILNLHSI
jgi:antirestriction protein ArdC